MTGKNIPVTLDAWEFKEAVDVANARMSEGNAAGMNNASTYERGYMRRLHQEVIGRCGEVAFCKVFNLYCPPSVNTFHAIPDVPHACGIEVRSTARDSGRLIIRDNDADDRWYVLVTGKPPLMTVRGRIKGADGRHDRWMRNPYGHRPAHFIPQEALLPLPGRISASV